jgi:hypothetical protein
MYIDIPPYCAKASVDEEPIQFRWGNAQRDEVLLDQPQMMARLNAISYRGVLCFSIGVVEWIIWRLSRHLPDETPFQAVQAAWAGNTDWRYLKTLDVPDWENELDEPIGAPLTLAFNLLTEIFIQARRVKPLSQHAAPLLEIPIKIISNPEPYKEWRRFSIQRLTVLCPMRPEDRLGPPVPREALDPEFNYLPEMAKQLLTAFLRTCDYRKNPYLNSLEEMLAAGFEGVPYAV